MSAIFRIMPMVFESTAEGVWRCDCLQRIGVRSKQSRLAPGRTADRLVIECSEEGFDEFLAVG